MDPSSEFLAYVGPPELHDAEILRVQRADEDLVVDLQTVEGQRIRVRFLSVTYVRDQSSLGMTIYSLSEMKHSSPGRSFVFANWDETSQDTLEVVATEVAFESKI
jgi:hypothetical protein